MTDKTTDKVSASDCAAAEDLRFSERYAPQDRALEIAPSARAPPHRLVLPVGASPCSSPARSHGEPALSQLKFAFLFAALFCFSGIPTSRLPDARCIAACLALLADLAAACFACFVSIFLKKGAFFKMSGSTMKRTWLPRKKQL